LLEQLPDQGGHGFIADIDRVVVQIAEVTHERLQAQHEIEVGIIRNLEEWPENAQELVNYSLCKRYFLHTIKGIYRIEVFNGYLNFDVETDLGPMQFMIRWQGDRAYNYGHGGKLLIDTDENRYLIPDVQKLSESERSLFLRYIYW